MAGSVVVGLSVVVVVFSIVIGGMSPGPVVVVVVWATLVLMVDETSSRGARARRVVGVTALARRSKVAGVAGSASASGGGAVTIDPSAKDEVPSTKGSLGG